MTLIEDVDQVFDIFKNLQRTSNPPIKSYDRFKRSLAETVETTNTVQMTERMAGTCLVALAAQGGKLSHGTTFSRVFDYRGHKRVMENGVSRDLLSAGLISIPEKTTPFYERFCLEEQGVDALHQFYDDGFLGSIGLL
ncbi:hypothetical protein [Silicimonas sp. MF1-12-2]|uniref:hypothetical protein n=1 Tax=Silicimonas sp. MF1-12-2 TaxID=3384793 RepID=UPI0039B673B0